LGKLIVDEKGIKDSWKEGKKHCLGFMDLEKFLIRFHLLTNKVMSLIVRGRFYSNCVQSSMLYGSETWPGRKE